CAAEPFTPNGIASDAWAWRLTYRPPDRIYHPRGGTSIISGCKPRDELAIACGGLFQSTTEAGKSVHQLIAAAADWARRHLLEVEIKPPCLVSILFDVRHQKQHGLPCYHIVELHR